MFWKPFVELVKVLRYHETVVPDVMPIHSGERIGRSIFNRRIGDICILIPDYGGIAMHETLPFEKR